MTLMMNGHRKTRYIVYLILLSFIISFYLPMTSERTFGQDNGLSYDNNTLYLHYNEDQPLEQRYFMDTIKRTNTSTFSSSVGLTGEFTLEFQLRPRLDRSLAINNQADPNLHVEIHLEAEGLNPYPLRNVWVEWKYGDSTIHSDAPDNVDPGVIVFDMFIGPNTILKGTQISLVVHFEVGAQSTFTLYTDLSSKVELSLLRDNDLDGDPDITDPDDDNDGFTDEEEIEAGTDPFDPLDHPTSSNGGNNGGNGNEDSTILYALILLFIILVVAGILFIRRR